MSNKKQTAVDWLLQQFDEEKTPRQWEEVYKRAKQLEKRQIIKDYCNGRMSVIDKEIIPAEQYYNDTYGND